jgi:type I restriction enzyme, S subunit
MVPTVDNLPPNWALASVGEIFNITYGQDFRKKHIDSFGTYPVYGANGIIGYHTKYTHEAPQLIIGCRGSVGNTHLTKGPSYITHNSLILDPAVPVKKQYLKHAIDFIDKTEAITGSSQPQITISNFSALRIPLAPYREQSRIVNKLEQLLAKVEACQERLNKIPVILKRFRQSVLAAACSGRLTVDWRRDDSSEDDRPTTWQATKLGRLTSLVTSGSRGWAKYYSKKGAIFIRAQNINADRLDLSDIAYVDLPHRTEGLRTKVKKDDLLVTITGANVTKSAIVLEDLDNAYVSQHVALVRLKDIKSSSFIFYWLLSPAHGREQLLESAYGQGKPGLNLDNIRSVDVWLPTSPEQQEIVRRVEALFKIADRIEVRYKKAKAHIDKLTQSILAKAFRGELVPQDPNDESATVLLERILALKDADAPITKACSTRSRKRYA